MVGKFVLIAYKSNVLQHGIIINNYQKTMEKPKKEDYGWHTQQSPDDLPSGWLIEGGEEAYYSAMTNWRKHRAIYEAEKLTEENKEELQKRSEERMIRFITGK